MYSNQIFLPPLFQNVNCVFFSNTIFARPIFYKHEFVMLQVVPRNFRRFEIHLKSIFKSVLNFWLCKILEVLEYSFV
jgi:hypothetical protein